MHLTKYLGAVKPATRNLGVRTVANVRPSSALVAYAQSLPTLHGTVCNPQGL